MEDNLQHHSPNHGSEASVTDGPSAIQEPQNPLQVTRMDIDFSKTYTYTPLMEDADAIRLVKILPKDPNVPGPPRCILEEHFLDLHPPFCALSYTWGPPEDVSDLFEKDEMLEHMEDDTYYAVFVDDNYVLAVRRNLMDFIYEISLQLAEPSYEGYDYFWIDAICINQRDLQERSFQVDIMGEIYKEAHDVLVWLGSDNREEMQSVKDMIYGTIDMGGKIIQQRDSTFPGLHTRDFWSSHVDKDRALQESKLPDFNDIRWWSFAMFFRRQWFTRLWVFQEVALARHISMMCGNIRFEIIHVDRCIKVLRWGLHLFLAEKWLTTLSHTFNPVGNSAFTICQMIRWCQLSENPYPELSIRQALVGPLKESGSAATWALLMDLCRMAETSESADQVYALLGIVRHLAREDTYNLRVDYSLSSEKVRMQITKHMIEDCDWLNIMCRVHHPAGHIDNDVASWVPVFDGDVLAKIFLFSDQFNACRSIVDGKLSTKLPRLLIDQIEIRTGGMLMSRVKGVSDHLHSKPYEDIARILIECPETYPAKKESKIKALWKTLAVHSEDSHENSALDSSLESSFISDILYTSATRLQELRKEEGNAAMLQCLETTMPYWQQLALSDPSSTLPNHEDIVEELVKWNLPVGGEVSHNSNRTEQTHLAETLQKSEQFRYRLGRFSTKRRFFVTENGYFGIGPGVTEVGDEVWLIPRTTVPFVLRPADEDASDSEDAVDGVNQPNQVPSQEAKARAFRVVGESFVYGVMEGEIIDDLDKRSSETGVDWEWSPITLI